MAGSRLTNFGTIFSRVTGLLETGAVKEVPLWYPIYKKYPPKLEPCSDRPVPPQNPILEIVYEEDFERSKRHNSKRTTDSIRSSRDKLKSQKIDSDEITKNN